MSSYNYNKSLNQKDLVVRGQNIQSINGSQQLKTNLSCPKWSRLLLSYLTKFSYHIMARFMQQVLHISLNRITLIYVNTQISSLYEIHAFLASQGDKRAHNHCPSHTTACQSNTIAITVLNKFIYTDQRNRLNHPT